MYITRKEGCLYWATPEEGDPYVYEGFLITTHSTASTFLVGPNSHCYGPPTGEWQLELLGVEGTEIEPEVGQSVGLVAVERPRPTCCDDGHYLTWLWPFPASRTNSGAPVPGWYTGMGTTGFSFWKHVGPNCPGCGTPLPDPGLGERVLGRQHLLGLLKSRTGVVTALEANYCIDYPDEYQLTLVAIGPNKSVVYKCLRDRFEMTFRNFGVLPRELPKVLIRSMYEDVVRGDALSLEKLGATVRVDMVWGS